MVKAPGHSSPPPRRYQFPLWGTPTHHALHAFMVLVALWPSCFPRGSITSNHPPGVKLYPPCSRPLATHSRLLPGGTSSLYNIYPSNTHETSFHCHIVVDGSTTMTTTPRSVGDAMLLANDAMPPNETLAPLSARSVMTATTTLRSGGDGNIIGEIATPFESRSVASMPGLATRPHLLAMTPCQRLLTTSRATTMPRLAMTQRSSTTGFDLLSEKIRTVHRAISPGIFLSDSDNLKQIAVNAASAVGHKVKS